MTITTAIEASSIKPQPNAIAKGSRLEVVDALRGFAIFAIMILHNLEQFDVFNKAAPLPPWLKSIDKSVWDTVSFLFAGKAYAIFALLFGFTFFIQMNNQAKKGVDFRLRFLWRLFLLLIFGCLNALIYEGDILAIYAVMGVALVLVSKWSDKALLIMIIILLLQPIEWFKVFYILNHPEYVIPKKMSSLYFAKSKEFLKGASFLELVKGNFLYGRTGVWFWTWEQGRFFQTPALFMLGMLMGRQGRFQVSEQSIKFWKRTLLISIVAFIPFFYLKTSISQFITTEMLAKKLKMIIVTWSNFAFMLVLVSSFAYLYTKTAAKRALHVFASLGRMSLSNYIIQSILGAFVYYGFGLGLYRYTGATYCLFIGLLLFTLQLLFCRWWLRRHKQGPLESLWHRLTWI